MDWQWNRDFIVLSLVSRYTILHSTTHEWEFGCWRPAVHEKMSPCDTMPQFAHIIIINIGSLNACKKFFHSRSIFLFTQFSLSLSLYLDLHKFSCFWHPFHIYWEQYYGREYNKKALSSFFASAASSISIPFESIRFELAAGWMIYECKEQLIDERKYKSFRWKISHSHKSFRFLKRKSNLLVSPHPPLSLHRCMQK